MHHYLESVTIREVALTYPRHLERLKMVATQGDAAAIVWDIVAGRPQEHFVVLHLDTKQQVVGFSIAGIGTVDSCVVHPREVFGPALKVNASSIIIAHNHPSGIVEPSPQDIEITNKLRAVGDILGIPVLDSIIVCDGVAKSLMYE